MPLQVLMRLMILNLDEKSTNYSESQMAQIKPQMAQIKSQIVTNYLCSFVLN